MKIKYSLLLLLVFFLINCSKDEEQISPTNANSSDETQARGSISGKLVTINGIGISGVAVTLTDSAGGGFSSSSDSLGQFRIPDVLGGTYKIYISHLDYYDTSFVLSIAIDEDGYVTSPIVLTSRFGSISGIVTDNQGYALSGCAISILSSNNFYSTTTDSSGTFIANGVINGIYSVNIATVTGIYQSVTVSSCIISAKSHNVVLDSIQLTKVKYTVSGKVVDNRGKPISGANATLTGTEIFTATTNDSGIFQFPNDAVPGGAQFYSVITEKSGYSVGRKSNLLISQDGSIGDFILSDEMSTKSITGYISGRMTLIDSVIAEVWGDGFTDTSKVKCTYIGAMGFVTGFINLPKGGLSWEMRLIGYDENRVSAVSETYNITSKSGDISVAYFDARNACPQFDLSSFVIIDSSIKIDDTTIVKSGTKGVGDHITLTVSASDNFGGSIVSYALDTNCDGAADVKSSTGKLLYTIKTHYKAINIMSEDDEGNVSSHKVVIYAAPKIKKIRSTSSHTLILTENGDVWGCGRNNYNQLALESELSEVNVVKLTKLPISGILDIAVGGSFSMFLTTDSILKVIGLNGTGSIGQGTIESIETLKEIATGVSAIGANALASMYGKSDGTVWASGNNNNYNLGTGNQTYLSSYTKVHTFATGVATQIEMSNNDSYVVNKYVYYVLYGCGINNNGELNQGSVTPVKSLTNLGVGGNGISVSVGNNYFLNMDIAGLRACGDNSNGSLGLLDRTNYTKLTTISQSGYYASAGLGHSLYLQLVNSSNGGNIYDLLGMGSNTHHQLSPEYGSIYAPTIIARNVYRAWAGERNSFYVDADKCRVYSMGENTYGGTGVGYSSITRNVELPTLLDW